MFAMANRDHLIRKRVPTKSGGMVVRYVNANKDAEQDKNRALTAQEMSTLGAAFNASQFSEQGPEFFVDENTVVRMNGRQPALDVGGSSFRYSRDEAVKLAETLDAAAAFKKSRGSKFADTRIARHTSVTMKRGTTRIHLDDGAWVYHQDQAAEMASTLRNCVEWADWKETEDNAEIVLESEQRAEANSKATLTELANAGVKTLTLTDDGKVEMTFNDGRDPVTAGFADARAAMQKP